MQLTQLSSIRRRAAVLAAVSTAAVVALAAPASAHVSVQPGEAEQGGYAGVKFRVPNENDSAGTTRLEVTLPEDKPLTSVRTRPLAGWTAVIEKKPLATPITSHGKQITEAVAKVTWTANPGVRINPGEYEDFEVSMGQLPTDTDVLVFKALQTYDNGDIVRWIDLPNPDGSEPEKPAPTLKLVPADGAAAAPNATPSGAGGSTGGSADQVTVSASSEDKSDSTARGLGIAGLVVGVLGLAAGAFGIVRGSRRNAAS
ncbi:YcnI family protein [Yinghuangia sp. ASG 101]|uniref:YcnI family protein n=1 Tax=Yinghuangia sp. ASG 101 TaxID=2896848 RepID=UPI001E2B41AE|nr:YcnI family protein [Yinghuangia sp. ASG 101]UGQ15203.1 YcnI family protein [Yinghuangia sp. ASG 101]